MAQEVNPLITLRAFVSHYPTQKAAAAALGIQAVYLGDMLRGRRQIGPPVLARLGLRRAVVTAKGGQRD